MPPRQNHPAARIAINIARLPELLGGRGSTNRLGIPAGFLWLSMTKQIERISGLSVYRLPTPISREIGRIVVRYAYFEQCVQEMVWQALHLGDAAGRMAVRDPRITDRLDMLRDIVGIHGAFFDEALFKSLRQRANLLAAKRHLLAHGIWYYHRSSDEWHVQLTRGSWPRTESELIAGSKKITPESVLITVGKLRSTTAELDVLIDDLKRLRSGASEAPASSP
jgi:hypothetical protein